MTQIWLDRRRGAAGSRLHMRLVLLCGVFTIMPTLIVAIILALLFINFTDFVVKPAQASFEAARAIGEPVRRAREERDPARHRGDLRATAGAWASTSLQATRRPSPRRSTQLIGGRRDDRGRSSSTPTRA